jgi:hypothetical protein
MRPEVEALVKEAPGKIDDLRPQGVLDEKDGAAERRTSAGEGTSGAATWGELDVRGLG